MTLLLVLLTASVVVLWPRGHRVGRLPAGGRRPSADDTPGVPARLRELLKRELRGAEGRRGWVAEFADLSAVGLDAGLPALEAARLACAVGGGPQQLQDLGALLAGSEASGRQVGDCLRHAAADDEELAFLAAAWHLSDEFGVAAAPAARLAAGVLRERDASAERRSVLAAGPRASMWLLTLLPLTGPLVVVLLGLPVGGVYSDGVAGVAALVGLSLTALGWAWSRAILRRAMRPGRML